jgi:hypothetical protein
MRAQLEAAKRRMRDYRDEMEASGLARGPAPRPEGCGGERR